jgi:hypothetical protein
LQPFDVLPVIVGWSDTSTPTLLGPDGAGCMPIAGLRGRRARRLSCPGRHIKVSALALSRLRWQPGGSRLASSSSPISTARSPLSLFQALPRAASSTGYPCDTAVRSFFSTILACRPSPQPDALSSQLAVAHHGVAMLAATGGRTFHVHRPRSCRRTVHRVFVYQAVSP